MQQSSEKHPHISVLPKETLGVFADIPAGVFVDATLGMGGHSFEILTAHPELNLVGIDQDPAAIEHAEKRLKGFGERVKIVHSNFSNISEVVKGEGIELVSGILADLGVSSLQLDSPDRGFSFRYDAPLDMRMNETSDDETAADLLATRSEQEIADIIYRFGKKGHHGELHGDCRNASGGR